MALTTFRVLKSALDITLTGESVSGETHTIPVSSPYEIYLYYVPKINSTATSWDNNTYVSVADMASAGISISIDGAGDTTISSSSSPAANTAYFQIIEGGARRYSTKVTFNSADAGLDFEIDYTGWMTLIEKELILCIHEALERLEEYPPCQILSMNEWSGSLFDNGVADDENIYICPSKGLIQFSSGNNLEWTGATVDLSSGDCQVAAFTDVDGYKKIAVWLIDNSGTCEARITEGSESATKGGVGSPSAYSGDAYFCGYVIVQGDGTGDAGGIEAVPQADISDGSIIGYGNRGWDGRYYTETEIDANTYTQSQVDTLLADYVPLIFVGSTGGLTLNYSETTANITASATVTINVDVPTNSLLLGCQLRVDAALAAGELWDAEWNDGSTVQTICSAQAVAQNTKVNTFYDVNAAAAITDAETDIEISKNGGGSFTAQGTIRAIAYYYSFTAMGDAS